MESWTLVYRQHHGKLSSRQRRMESYRDATKAYNELRRVQRQAQWEREVVIRFLLNHRTVTACAAERR